MSDYIEQNEHKSPSYNPKACCWADCFKFYSNTKDDPCWGDVEVVGEECTADYEDCWWIHACQGHKDIDYYYLSGNYRQEPKDDNGVVEDNRTARTHS